MVNTKVIIAGTGKLKYSNKIAIILQYLLKKTHTHT